MQIFNITPAACFATMYYRQTSYIKRTIAGKKTVVHFEFTSGFNELGQLQNETRNI